MLRLGGPNFHEIPINRPVCGFANNQRDGFHRMTIKTIGATNEGVDLLAACQLPGVALAGSETSAQLSSQLGVVTIRNAADMGNLNQQGYFSQALIDAIAQHRQWDREQHTKSVPA